MGFWYIAMLRRMSGNGYGAQYVLNVPEGRVFSIGRHASNDLILTSEEIPYLASRFHAQICVGERGYHWIKDTGSSNGTYVNGVEMKGNMPYMLRPNDTITFGGPSNVVRDGNVKRNPFKFRFIPPHEHAYERVMNHGASVDSQTTTGSGKRKREADTATTSAHTDSALLDGLKSELECSICQELMVLPHSLPACGHTFCAPCIFTWRRRQASVHSTCPICRKDATEFPVPATGYKRILENLVEPRLGRDEMDARRQKLAQWNEETRARQRVWQQQLAEAPWVGRRAQTIGAPPAPTPQQYEAATTRLISRLPGDTSSWQLFFRLFDGTRRPPAPTP